MQHFSTGALPFLEKARETAFETSLLYNKPTQPFRIDGHELAITKIQPPRLQPDNFSILVERNVTLCGYRTYATSDGYIFTDESLLRGFDRATYLRKLQSHLHEDLGATIEGENIRIHDKPIRHISGPAMVLASNEPSNYGSWIYRILPKLIDGRKAGINNLVLFCNSPWMENLISLAINSFNIIRYSPSYAYRIEEAYIPTVRNTGVYFDKGTIDFYQEVALRSGGTRRDGAYIYLARRGGKRPIKNEPELEIYLENRGFECIDIAKIPTWDQIAKVKSAKIIVCCGGSGLFNMVFSDPNCTIIDVEPNAVWTHAHGSLMSSLNRNFTMLKGLQEEANPHSSWSVDIQQLGCAINYALC